MIVKDNSKPPIFLRKLEALTRRLPQSHPKWVEIKEKHRTFATGYAGEKALHYPLSFTEGTFHLFFDLRLKHSYNKYFQMDSLLVTPSFMLIIEAKNISGTLFFDDRFQQVIRTNETNESALPDPIQQVGAQKTKLKQWLLEHNYPVLPIETLVVSANRYSVLKASDTHSNATSNVIRIETLPHKISYLQQKYPTSKMISSSLSQLSDELLLHHQEYSPNVLALHQLKPENLQKGLFCNECEHLPMRRIHSKWVCPSCSHLSTNEHIHALRDFALLIDSSINNPQLREFLMVNSRHTAKHILSKLDVVKIGENKGSRYSLEKLL
ncbi:NERD domain-containing protein [Pontibacillus yanchengensis]|uniref:NERD domain-containing protein n=1 Tax=Pontibacillus yanchengensis TaxID=462910 RepID=A0A6I5A0T7_9BACI|nr:nuclease-related domain-containing protein [Pontibacillus yanchengensis]MYL33873.1 NERD domain-containing protein [Pontibacillus yanchengensis]